MQGQGSGSFNTNNHANRQHDVQHVQLNRDETPLKEQEWLGGNGYMNEIIMNGSVERLN